jgi:RNA-directed DNA polymerase
VIDLDIKGFFDNIGHELLLKAVDHHISEPWMRCYIRRWLVAPMQTQACGTLLERIKGTPQGGVISPLLANLFLHYVFDYWMQSHHRESPFARYADDAVIHCRSRSQAQELLQAIKERFEACGLELHPLKTKIVYCKDDARHESHEHEKFTFLSYEFRARKVRTRYGNYFVGFNPAISREAVVRLREEIRSWKLLSQTRLSLEQLGKKYNAKIRGWINYYGRFYGSQLRKQVLRYLNDCLARWAAKKFKRLHGSQRQARRWLHKIFHREASLFAHWSQGVGMYG